MQFPPEISGDEGSITNVKLGGVVDYSLSWVCENENGEHTGKGGIENTFTPTHNVSVYNLQRWANRTKSASQDW